MVIEFEKICVHWQWHLGNFNALLHVFEVGKNDFNGATNSIDGCNNPEQVPLMHRSQIVKFG